MDPSCESRESLTEKDYIQFHKIPLKKFAGPNGYSPRSQQGPCDGSNSSYRPLEKKLEDITDNGDDVELPIGLCEEIQAYGGDENNDIGAMDANLSMRNLLDDVVPRPFSSNSDIPSKKTRSLDSQRPIPINIKLAQTENPRHQNFFTSVNTPVRRMQTMLDLRDYEQKMTLHFEQSVKETKQREETGFTSLFKHRVVRAIVLGFRLLTMVTVAVSLVHDLTFMFKSTFASEEFFIVYVLILSCRLVAPICYAGLSVCSENEAIVLSDAKENKDGITAEDS